MLKGKNPFSQPVAVNTPAPQPVAPTPAEPHEASPVGQMDQGSKAELYTVIIQSTPPGARIIINGQDTGMITPAQRSLEGGKEFTIGLRKDGYQFYERKDIAKQSGHLVNASLLPMPKMGYVNLDLINGGSNPVVFINGQRIEEKLPLKNYAVLAGTPVTIKAHNPFTGLSAEQVVTVGTNQRISVNLILAPRKPTGQ
jgi:serine/threonine-protein kinase